MKMQATKAQRKKSLQNNCNINIDWDKFVKAKQDSCPNFCELRNEIIEQYIFLLNSIADHMSRKFPPSVTADDCRQAGFFGLCAAVEGFDPARKVNFIKYASIRIRGSILDFVRSLDPLSRQMRSKKNKFSRTIEKLEKSLARTPSDDEIKEELGISDDEFRDYFCCSVNSTIISLNEDYTLDNSESGMRILDLVKSHHSAEPSAHLEEEEFFLDLMKGFSEKEILIMTLYYKEMLSLKEIGAVLDLSESRVSQLRSEVLIKRDEMIQELKEKISR